MSKKYASHVAQFKFKVALEAIKGTKTSAELCQEFGLSSSQIYAWKKQLEDAGPEVFSNKKKKHVFLDNSYFKRVPLGTKPAGLI